MADQESFEFDQSGSLPSIDSPATFVGRIRELDALISAIQRPGFVTITGISGIGKTRMAIELCRRIETDRRSGVTGPLAELSPLFVALSDDADSGGVSVRSTISRARETSLTHGSPNHSAPFLRELLVLDDAGFLPNASMQIRDLIEEYHDSRFLVTSPRPLGIAGEHLLRLGSLSPTSASGTDHQSLGDHPAVQLFIDRAMSASVTFRADPSDLSLILELCRLLDCIPLAIELAAAKAGMYPPAVLLAQIRGEMGFAMLGGAGDDVPVRHRSVRAALEWNYQRLPAASQLLLESLSAFASSFSPEGAAFVASSLSDDEVFDALSDLVDCHLIEPVTTDPTVGRFEMLHLVRQFARQRVSAAGRTDEVELERTHYITDLAKQAAAAFDRHDHAMAFATLEHEWTEISAVINRLIANGDVVGGLELALDCAPFLLRVGFDSTAHARLERLIEDTKREDPNSPLLTRALLWSAVLTRLMAHARPDPQWIHGRLEEGIQRARSLLDHQSLLMGLEFTVLCAAVTGDVPLAAAATAEGLELTGGGTDESWLARFEGLACMVSLQLGDAAGAAGYGLKAIRRAIGRNDHPAMLRAAIAILGLPAAAEQEAFRYLPNFDELIALSRELRDRYSEQFLLGGEASRCLTSGDDERAATLSADLLALLIARGEAETIGVGFANSVLVAVAAGRGDFEMAARLYGSIEKLGPAVVHAASPSKREAYLGALAATEASLGETKWKRERAAGATCSGPEAARLGISYALALVPRVESSSLEVPDSPVHIRRSELEVLRALVQGKSNKEIAQELNLSPKTVMHYLSAIYKRIGVRGRAAATAWALRSGILDD